MIPLTIYKNPLPTVSDKKYKYNGKHLFIWKLFVQDWSEDWGEAERPILLDLDIVFEACCVYVYYECEASN